MYFGASNGSTTPAWQSYTLIMPAISVGNVGQLACDLLIHTLKLTKVGCLHDHSLEPLCGNDAFLSTGVSSGKLVTSTEVYESSEKKIVVIQQRASFVKGRVKEFRRKLLDWIKQVGFARTVLLTSCFAYEKTDAHMLSSSRYLMTPSLEKEKDSFVTSILKYQQLEKKPQLADLELAKKQDDIPEAARDIYLPGGGIAKKLFIDSCKADVPLAVLMHYCSESDNTQDAVMMASFVNSLLQLILEPSDPPRGDSSWRTMWKIPNSWTTLFGRPIDPTMY
ncbi:proteasome assembly chaperone 2-like [Diadema antillarum]|uniref:proteasome assembly chaperone 2-like n=1 Tax=Diadema antillarum TaxID=105358 RepID=UPI003A8B54CB